MIRDKRILQLKNIWRQQNKMPSLCHEEYLSEPIPMLEEKDIRLLLREMEDNNK